MEMQHSTAVHEPRVETAGRRPVTDLSINGMTCNNCARHVTEALQKVPGVHSAVVSLEQRHAAVRWAPGTHQNPSALIQAVTAEGYEARLIQAHDHEHDHGPDMMSGWGLNLWIGLPATVLMMSGEWVFGLGTTRWFQWLGFALGTLVQVVAGARFYRGAWGQLKVGSSNMDTLVTLGSTTAFGYSAWALLGGHGGHVYFMEAAAIITLISLGHWVESRVSARASSALRGLLDLAPARAHRRQPNGTEAEVLVTEVQTDDLLILKPGDRVPTDGVVVEGDAVVDESMLTGESAPVDKAAGSELYAGTTNLNGRLVMRVTTTGEETALAHIIAAVQRAQTSRANIQRIGDRISSVFVPVVVGIALAAGLWWALAPDSARQVHDWLGRFLWAAHVPTTPLAAAFIIASAVLIIACPCAMGLATPAAIMAGSNAAAQRGILIRDGVALEKAGTVTTVVFDKTGTLTAGRPTVEKVFEPSNAPTGEMVPLAVALARHSTHPVSRAVGQMAGHTVELADWTELRGSGVQARTRTANGDSQQARLGSLRWLGESGVDLSAGQGFIAEWSAQGATLVGVAEGHRLRGLFAMRDRLKPGARQVVEQLRREGLRTCLLTGDNSLTAASIGREAGIPAGDIFAEVRPEQKAEFVSRLQQQGERVAFVGDGINDAPALEQADLGIAVSRASDIAREAADIILLKSEIEAVPESLGLARATLRTIKQNLFWAFFYNAIGVPLAALGFMSPILCAAAMGLSDLVVIGNALRLRGWRR
jgi:Cu+-exporting ATPase